MDARSHVLVLSAAALLIGGAAVARADVAAGDDPLSALGGQWIQLRTPSVRVFTEVDRRPSGADLERLEATVQRLCDEFDVDFGTRASLMRVPIDYVLTDDTSLIDRVTGIEAEGAAFTRRRLILATSLPHEHELVHVIAHLALGTQWGGNASFLEEGLASAVGGHAGEHPRAVMVAADEVLARGRVSFERMLTEQGFDTAPGTAHERYAVAARFVDYLMRERGGWPRLREVLLILAGEPDEIRRRPARVTRLQLEGTYDTTFDELVADFLRWIEENPAARGLRDRVPVTDPDATARDARHHLSFWEDDGEWVFEIGAAWGMLAVQIGWTDDASRDAWNAAGARRARFELEVDRTGAALRDQRDGRLLMRWSAADEPVRATARLRLDPRELGLVRPRHWSVWSRPEVPTY